MLALRDQNHEVMASVPGLAKVANIPRKECEEALEKLMSPDPDSRSQDYGGRRIAEVDGGWRILNGEEYRRKMSEESRREYKKIWMQNKRLKSKLSQQMSTKSTLDNVDDVDTVEQSRVEKSKEEKIYRSSNDNRSISGYSEAFSKFWEEYPRKVGKKKAWESWKRFKCYKIFDEIIESISLHKQSEQWEQNGGEFIPHPTTWLNRGGWEDEVRKKKEWYETVEEELREEGKL